MTELSPEIELLVEKGRKHEQALRNGGRENIGCISDGVVHLIEVNRFQLKNQYISATECARRMKGRPRVSVQAVLGMLVALGTICLTLLKLTGKL